VITEELSFVHEINQDIYDKPKAWIKMHHGFSFPMIGLINIPLQVGLKLLDVSFSIIPQSNQICVKLGYKWLHSMKAVPSIVHKCLNFPFDNEIYNLNHNGFNTPSI
jgi:hypothetical protein